MFKEMDACLDEVDRELFRVADHDECKRFHNDTRLTAVLLLFLRCSSLLRSLLTMFRSRQSDGFQAVLRAFEEAWNLAYDLRFVDQNDKTVKWLAESKDTWSADIQKIKQHSVNRGIAEPIMGRVYGRLSEVSHPTKSAALNSVTLCGQRLKIKGADAELAAEYENEALCLPDAFYRLVWLMLDGDKVFIPCHVKKENLPLTWKFVDGDKRLEPPPPKPVQA
jgi:hypothetical protein